MHAEDSHDPNLASVSFATKILLSKPKTDRVYHKKLNRMETPTLAPSPDLNTSVSVLRKHHISSRASIFKKRLPSISPLRKSNTKTKNKS